MLTLASVPIPKLIVYRVPPPNGAAVTTTPPPAPPMLDRAFSSDSTCDGGASKGIGLVGTPLNVRVNVPLVPLTWTVRNSDIRALIVFWRLSVGSTPPVGRTVIGTGADVWPRKFR